MSFEGTVHDGVVVFENGQPPPEGARVNVIVRETPASANGQPAVTPPKPAENAEFDPEPPPWLEVENDVYFPINVPEISLGKVNIRVEKGEPCIILPEELPDD